MKAVGPGKLVTHDELADLLWRKDPDGGPMNAKLSIRVAMHKARKKLKGYSLSSDRTGYRLEIQDVQ